MADPPPARNLVRRVYDFAQDVLHRRNRYAVLVPLACWLADAVLCALIIWKVPYTEIDWTAYMEQVAQYVAGERDYTLIKGGTGPLVYPGAHVYIYTGLYYITDAGRNIFLAQQLFAVLYQATLGVVMTCYWNAGVTPVYFPFLILSKRLHSIFMLRCFNDCFAVCFLWVAILLLQRRQWALAGIIYSFGLGIKMSLLLSLPGIAVVIFLGRGFWGSLRVAWLMMQVQIAIAVPFAAVNPGGYFGRAFEFSRQFFFRWTVNWRFVGEEVFLSREFAATLLALHASVLLLFVTTRWLRPSGRSLTQLLFALLRGCQPLTEQEEQLASFSLTPEFILTTILTSNLVGLVFARSLHYQFYAYLAWTSPFLLWRTGTWVWLQAIILGLQEWAWNVFPSTPGSSFVVIALQALLVALVWLTTNVKWVVQPRRGAQRPSKMNTKKPLRQSKQSHPSSGGPAPILTPGQ